MTRTDMTNAASNAKLWLETIEEMVRDLQRARDGEVVKNDRGEEQDEDSCRQRIEESVLSVQVRNGWRSPGQANTEGPNEYEILLSTGGPALRIFGGIGRHGEPDTAELQMQDWGTPWTRYPAPEATLLAFASAFYFAD